jgi:hypothetical protein
VLRGIRSFGMRADSVSDDDAPVGWIREVVCASGGDLFVAAEFDSRVEIYSLTQRERVSKFETVIEARGRLGFSCESRPKLLAGAYNRYGVRAYDPLSGEEIWRRPDLKRVQYVCGTRYGVAVGVEGGPLRLLDTATGEPTQALRGVSALYAGEHGLAVAAGVSGSHRFAILDLEHDARRVWSGRSKNFVISDAAVGSEAIAIADLGITCFNLDGVELWHWSEPDSFNVHAMAWRSSDELLVAGWRGSGKGTTVLAFKSNGTLSETVELPPAFACAFSRAGRRLVASIAEGTGMAGEGMTTGMVFDLPHTQPIWTFRAPAPLRAASTR